MYQRRLFPTLADVHGRRKQVPNGGNKNKETRLFDSFFCCVLPGAGGQRPLPCGGPAEEWRSQAPPLLFWGPEQRNGTENVQKFFLFFSEPTCRPDANMVKPTVVDPV